MRQILCLLLFALASLNFAQAEGLIAHTALEKQHLSTLNSVVSPDTISFIVYNQTTVVACADTLEVQPIASTTITVVSQETSSSFFVGGSQPGCIDYNASSGQGTDTLLVAVCNDGFPVWCDTTIMVFSVIPPPLPVANDDNVNVMENDTLIADVLSNDEIVGNIGTFITEFPDNGTADFENDMLLYIPDPNFCGADSLVYNVCNGNCAEAVVIINVICDNVDGEYRIYNSFSPNGDGINDKMAVAGVSGSESYRLRVFSRWGIEVFDSRANNDSFEWDGTWNGKDLPDGTYYYTFETPSGNIDKGFVQIYR